MKTLKEVLILVAMLVFVVVVFFGLAKLFNVQKAEAEPLETFHSSLHLVRATAAEDGATFAAALDLAAGEGDFANKPSNAFRIRPLSDIGRSEGMSPGAAWLFYFAGNDTTNDTFSFTMVGWARINGPAQVICHGDCVLGTQDVVLYPHDSSTATNVFWADTVNIDSLLSWPSINQYNSAGNEIGILAVDLTGIEFVQFFIYDAAGGGTEATTVTVYGRRY